MLAADVVSELRVVCFAIALVSDKASKFLTDAVFGLLDGFVRLPGKWARTKGIVVGSGGIAHVGMILGEWVPNLIASWPYDDGPSGTKGRREESVGRGSVPVFRVQPHAKWLSIGCGPFMREGPPAVGRTAVV
jgi:hypothetical protein